MMACNHSKFEGSSVLGDFDYDQIWVLSDVGDHGSEKSGETATDYVLSDLPEDPFRMDIMFTLEAAMIMWFHDNQSGLGSDSGQPPGLYEQSLNPVIDHEAVMFQQLMTNDISRFDKEFTDYVLSDLPEQLMGSIRTNDISRFDKEFTDYVLSDLPEQLMGSIRTNDISRFDKEFTETVLNRLPENPFCINLKSTSNAAFSDWSLHENRTNLRSASDDVTCSDGKVSSVSHSSVHVLNFEKKGSDDCVHGEPHYAFTLVLPYLQLKDLIAVEGVCKSLRDAVRKEPYLWNTICIDLSLSDKVTVDSILRLTLRAEGNLQYLSLDGCNEITDEGLLQVLASNPRLKKLSIEGCGRLSAKGILLNLKVLNDSGMLELRSIRTGGRLYFTCEQLEELNSLLSAHVNAESRSKVPRINGSKGSQIFLEDGQATDLEICPRCGNPGLLYNYSTETCKGNDESFACRTCILCVERCIGCGRSVSDCEYEELFCLSCLCFACCKDMVTEPWNHEEPELGAVVVTSP